jgi:hypothetical protein
LQFDREGFSIPASLFGEPVVGEHVRPDLGGTEMRDPNRRNELDTSQLGGLNPGVTCDQLALGVNDDRAGVAEPRHAIGELLNLRLGMGSGISVRRSQPGRGQHFDGPGQTVRRRSVLVWRDGSALR